MFDCKMPVQDDQWCSTDDGGEYPDWSDRTSTKHPLEVRMHFGVMMKRDAKGELQGYKMEPWDYTGKWVVGPAKIEEEVKKEVSRVSGKKGGEWSCTKDYTAEDVADLPGGRYQARRIVQDGGDYAQGDGWRDEVVERLGKGEHALVDVNRMIDHTIDQGNILFKGTPYEDTWMILWDRLSAVWSKAAQQHLASRGMKDRQVRAWGETNSEYWRYHEAVTGDRPEFNALDFRLFRDFEFSLTQNIIRTSSLDVGDKRRFDDGNQEQLRRAMLNTWIPGLADGKPKQQPCIGGSPTSAQIVRDISRFPLVVDKIIEYKGGVVPDHAYQAVGCSKQKRKVSGKAAAAAPNTPKGGSHSSMYDPSAEVAKVTADRTATLKRKAKSMATGPGD
jgi:hypothetical protein